MKFTSANADLSAKAKLTAIAETRGGIPIDRSTINFAQELFCRPLILRYDQVAVM